MCHCEMIAYEITQMRHISPIFPILNGSHEQFNERFLTCSIAHASHLILHHLISFDSVGFYLSFPAGKQKSNYSQQ